MRSCCVFHNHPSFHVFTLVFFKLLCYVMLATSSSLSLTPFTYLAGRLWLFILLLVLAFRNSLMSSSHLFLGLPIALLVLYFELSSGFHSAALINHLSLGDVAILSASLHFIFCESCYNIESSHFPSFLWHRLCFFLCIRSNLPLQISVVSISSSVSFSNGTSLSWSL